MTHPLFGDWRAPFGMPPLGGFQNEDFGAALREARTNVDAIAANPEASSFAKIIEMLDRAEKALNRARYCAGGTGQLRSPSSQAR